MTKPISRAISDPDMWEQFSDDLERFMAQASSAINDLGDEKSANSVYEILITRLKQIRRNIALLEKTVKK